MELMNVDESDMMIWSKSRDGKFSVKSAYYSVMEELLDNSSLRVQGNWMKIWKLRIPQMVKLFLWRAARGCLPTRVNLNRRHVECTRACPFCELSEESHWHTFFGCSYVEQVWIAAGLWQQILYWLHRVDDFKGMIFAVLSGETVQTCQQFAMVLWCLWKRRNEKVWEDRVKPISTSLKLAMDMLIDWLAAQVHNTSNINQVAATQPVSANNVHNYGMDRNTPTSTTTSLPSTFVASNTHGEDIICNFGGNVNKWCKPAAGELKCNVDATIFGQVTGYGIGMCIRHEKGDFVKAKSLWKEVNIPPQEAEATGLYEAILWLRELGIQRATIKLDCKSVVDGVVENLTNVAEFGTIIRKCKALLNCLQNFK
ncbi:ribonuclease H protein, partial [Trifolium medium]|nr:ribonuclease H protein [Trifolium medium]